MRVLPLVVQEDVVGDIYREVGYQHMDFFSLYLVRQGRGTHWIDGHGYGIARGDVYAMGLGQTHWFTDCESLVLDTLHFSPAIFEEGTLDALSSTPGFQALFVEAPHRRAAEGSVGGGRWLHLAPEAYALAATQMAELHREWSAGTPEGTLLTQGLFLRLLVTLARQYAARPGPAHDGKPARRDEPGLLHDSAVAAAVHYLDAHFSEPVRIEQVAASVFLSPDYFTRIFVQVMGQTPRDYLRHLRLEHAKLLLTKTSTPISNVAEQAGFGEAAYLARAFQAGLGMTPRQWRARRPPAP